jgi:hypothetical protein
LSSGTTGCENSSTSSWPRFQHAAHVGKRGRFVGDVAQAETDGDAVEHRVGKRKLLGVGEYTVDVADHAGIEQAVATFAQHRAVDVGEDHHAGLAHLFREAGSKVPGAARDVEGTLAGPQASQ